MGVIVGVVVLLGFVLPGMEAEILNKSYERPHPAFFVIMLFIFLIFVTPGAMLLGEQGRRAFYG